MRFYHSVILQNLSLLLLTLLSVTTVQAHQKRPAIVTISFEQDAVVKVQVQTNAEAILSGIGSEHENTDDAPQVDVYRALRELPSADLTEKFKSFANQFSQGLSLQLGGQQVQWQLSNITVPEVGDTRLSRKSEINYHAVIPPDASTALWSFDQKYGDAVVNFISQGQAEKTTYWLVKGQPSPEYHLYEKIIPRSWSAVALDYIGLGYIHILPKGLDHILFVLGLFLLSKKFKPLLWQVTAFTLAHTITLALSIYGLISASVLIIEPLIALSIAYVGIENLLTRELKPWRVVIVFLFGLLHGMGFAGVLTELGLPESQFVTALITFNVGVELGQLSFVFLVLWMIRSFRILEIDWPRGAQMFPGYVVGSLGAFWTIQRTFMLLGSLT